MLRKTQASLVTALALVAAQAGCRNRGAHPADEADTLVTPDGAAVSITVGSLPIDDAKALASASLGEALPKAAPPPKDAAQDREPDDVIEGQEQRSVSENDRRTCATQLGVTPDVVQVVGSQERIAVKPGEAVMLKVNGHKTHVTATIRAQDPEQALAGLCVVASGNKTVVELDVQAKVKSLVYQGRGNKSRGRIALLAGGALEDGKVQMRGNKTVLAVQGDESLDCAKIKAVQDGNKTSYSCDEGKTAASARPAPGEPAAGG